MVSRVVGRESELATLVARLDQADAGHGGAADVVGEAGIGKTTLLDELALRARRAGGLVWRTAPTQAESQLPWAALAPLLENARDTIVAAPERVQDALRAIWSASSGGPIHPTSVALAFAEVLAAASADHTLVLLLDDAHWIDPSSAGALAHAIRTVPRLRCLVVVSRRPGTPPALEPARLVPHESTTSVVVGGLSVASLHRLLDSELGRDISPGVVAAIHDRTRGNPLYAGELARSVAAGASLDGTRLPPSMRDALTDRVRRLPADTAAALRVAAALATPDLEVIAAIVSDPLTALAPAEADGIVSIASVHSTAGRRDVVTFSHPLLAAASLDTAPTADLRRLHAQLADLVPDAGEGALHLAASRPNPSTAVAARLEGAGDLALDRGAPELAATLLSASADTTPADAGDERVRRLLRVAAAQTLAGGTEAVATLEAIDAPPGSDVEAEVAAALVLPTGRRDGMAAGLTAARRALGLTRSAERRASLHRLLVYFEWEENAARARVAAIEAVRDAERSGPGPWLDVATSVLAVCDVLTGDLAGIDHMLTRVAAWSGPWSPGSPPEVLMQPLVWTDHPAAVRHITDVEQRARAIGGRITESNAWDYLAEIAVRQGRWDDADRQFRESRDIGPSTLAQWALLQGLRGRTDDAADLLAQAALRRRGAGDDAESAAVESMTAFAAGADDAAARLLRTEDLAIGYGLGAVRVVPYRRDLVEALLAADRVDDAHVALDRLNADAERAAFDSASADATAAAGVVAAADGDTERARELLAVAAKLHDHCNLPYEHARTLLAAGSVARRSGRRSDARTMLDDAAAAFAAMGAAPWRRRCGDELARLGRTRSSSNGDLTPTELQIARHVAGGHSNAEVAAALFVSVRTVESNLTRVFRKLGVRSRTQLARHPALADDVTR